MEIFMMFFPALITTLGMEGMKFDKPLKQDEEEKYLKLYCDKKDEKAKEKLILQNLRLVANIAKKYTNKKYDKDDLISIGTVGLIKGINTFRNENNNKLSTYISRCIENEILMYLRKNKKTLEEVSLNDISGIDKDGNEMELIDTIKDECESIFDMISKKENYKKIKDKFNKVLKEDEAYIVKARYGIFGVKKITQEEIAKRLNISRSYVSRLEKIALLKLKKVLENWLNMKNKK